MITQMKKSAKSAADQAFAKKASRQMIDAVSSMIEAYSRKNKDADPNQLMIMFLEQFVSVLVYQTLAKERDKSLPVVERHKLAKKNFTATKLAMQEAIAEGFGTGASAYAGALIEYFCIIKAIPEEKTKVPS